MKVDSIHSLQSLSVSCFHVILGLPGPCFPSACMSQVTMSCSLTLQICQIISLSFHCRCWRFGIVNGQVPLALSIPLCTQELYTRPRVLKERWLEERTGSSCLNFFQAVFTHVVGESLQLLAAESMSPR